MADDTRLRDYLKRVTADLHRSRQRLREVEAAAAEPIAIVGMACRFAGGVSSPEELWDLLMAGADVREAFPADRGWDLEALRGSYPGAAGERSSVGAGFLRDVGDFDAGFFGISPREALAMDPQQRLLLETSWEALERATLDPARLRGSETGVFVGASASGYGSNLREVPEGVGGYLMTGGTSSVMSGRIAYSLGLEGPTATVDTACSSSLVALHFAVQALRNAECSLALVGGVTVMAAPTMFSEVGQKGGLAADARCKAFAAQADGTGFSEGVGVLVVERLSDAQRNGHQVLAVVRGTAMNSDGASSGLTTPNGPSQQRVIRAALANARLSAADIDLVEAHGTGTTLGDPIEAQALLSTYGRERAGDEPLWLGSLKSNIGHSQCAAGVAGVIKLVLALRHGMLPQTLHVDEPTPQVDWTAGAVELLTEARPWPETGRPKRAAVSSFGISGTNAHAVIEQAPELEPATDTPEAGAPIALGQVPWALSAKSAEALAGQARRLSAHAVANETLSVADLGLSLASTRSAFRERAVLVGSGREALLAGVDALAGGREVPGLVRGVAEDAAARPVFVFPGQGSQWVGMGRGLLACSPAFADRMAECAAALEPFVDWTLLDVLEDAIALERVDVVQPVLFAVMVSLAEVWRSYGVEPAAVVGHSQGEIAAAVVAGGLSLEDGARVVSLRSKAIAKVLAGRGGMVSVALPVEDVRARIGTRASIAAVNGPSATVVSGTPQAMADLLAGWEKEGVRARRIPVDYASHSAQVEDLREQILADLALLRPLTPSVPLFSTVTGDWLGAAPLDAEYWLGNLRQTVLFEDAVRALAEQGFGAFIECSAHPVLTAGVQDTAGDAVVVGSLRRDDGGAERMTLSLAEAFVRGVPVNWSNAFAGSGARQADLPTYAFQHRRYWWDLESVRQPVGGPGDPVDAAFWAAVEAADLDSLAATLDVGGDSLSTVLPALTSWHRKQRTASTVDGWRYQVQWAPVGAAETPTLSGLWLVLTPEDSETRAVADVCARALGAHGAQVRVVPIPHASQDRAALAQLLDDPAVGVVSLLALDEQSLEGFPAVPGGYAGTLALIQALGDREISAPLWCLTQGAVSVATPDLLANPGQALAWGLGRVAGLEHPERWGGLIDLPAVVDERVGARLVAVLGGLGEDQVAVRSSGVFARRLAPSAPAGTPAPAEFRGTVLVTGGTGGLGAHVARWLAGRGAEHLVLAGRRGPDAPGATELAAELTELGARVTITACDVGDREAVTELLANLGDDCPLTAVVHVAALLDDTVVDGLTPDRLDRVLRVKAQAAWHLHELTRDLALDAFILFSSVAGVLGASGQGNYAPGNAYLDALAEYRRGLGLTATSVAWGPWAGSGMADSAVGQVAERHGMRLMAPDLAIRALESALARPESCATIADVEWPRFHVAYTANRPSPFLSDVPQVRNLAQASAVDSKPAAGGLAGRLAGLSPADQDTLVLTVVRDQVAQVLGHATGQRVEAGRGFKDLGFDSVLAVELRNRMNAATGLKLPATLIFDYPTARALATHLRRELLGEDEVRTPVTPQAPDAGEDAIAVVGMSCRFPGGVRTPAELWELLVAGGDGITEFPRNRGWDTRGLYHPDPDHPGTSYAAEGGFLHDADEFDAAFFGISPREAMAMDPQQRLLLETSWEALEHAGLDPAALHGSETGVFAGTNGQDYTSLLTAVPPELEGYLATGNTASVLSGRIAYTLGLEGPAVTIDTACSSSLVSLHLAAQSLRRGECTLALAGGVSVMSTPAIFTEFSRQRGLAADGRSKAFAAAADGAGFAEGAGVLVLERLSDAQRLGHPVLAVLRGSAINQDGASNGLTAPNGPSQQRVIRAALADARLSASEVDAVEAHGTGTTLGDPIEAQALLATYGRDRSGEPLWLGSIKSNFGHTQAAAGVAGAIKMVLGLRHGVLPKTLHIDAPTSEVDWSAGTVELVTETRPWPATDRPRRGGVSSFGISGTNVHVIFEQAPPADDVTETAPVPAVVPWVLSGRSAASLREQAARLVSQVETCPGLSPADVGFSLVTSRSSFEHRAVVTGGSLAELLAGANAVAAGIAVTGVAGAEPITRPVFVFPGQGSQWVGMAQELLESSSVFASRMVECANALESFVDWTLSDVLGDAVALERVDVVQPALFAVMVSLAEVWRFYGIEPAAVVGHSQGEIAAAVVAGGLSLEDGARVVALRSKVIAKVLAGRGGMVSVALPVAEVRERVAVFGDLVSIAAVNGPSSTVVSGTPEALDVLLAGWEKEEVRARRIPVDYASHSAQVEDLREQILADLAPLQPLPPTVPVFSTVTGEWLGEAPMDAEYWLSNLRQTVFFEDAVTALSEQGFGAFIECSAHPVLTVGIQETVEDAVVVGSLRRDDGGARRMLTSLGEVFVRGVAVDWTNAFTGARRVDLPTYAFQRQRYWWEPQTVHQPVSSAGDPVDEAFWQAVEGEDVDTLAATLDVGGEPLAQVLPALISWRHQRRVQSDVDSLRYLIDWAPLATAAPALSGTWLLVTAAGHENLELRDGLVRHGATEVVDVVVHPGDDRAAITARLRGLTEPAGVLSLLATDEDVSSGYAAEQGPAVITSALVQALGDAGIDAPLWCATRDAVTTGPADAAVDPAQTAVWGLGRVVALERPDRWGGLLDLPGSLTPPVVASLAAVLSGGQGEDQVAVRPSGVYGRRLIRAAPVRTETPWRAEGTILITGGTGALGGHVARWLAENGAEHLLLISRRGPSAPGSDELRAELAELGARVTIEACDAADRDALAALLATHPVSGIVHTSGVVDDGVVDALTPGRFDTVFAPKALAAKHLHELTLDRELSLFVLFSSFAGTTGNSGQGNYAAANAYLDGLAEERHRLGLAATSIGWGAWAGAGLAGGVLDRMDRDGVPTMAPELAVTALRPALEQGHAVEAVARIDWDRMILGAAAVRPNPLLGEIPEVRAAITARPNGEDDAEDGSLVRTLAGLSEPERLEHLTRLVRTLVAAVLGHPTTDGIGPRRAFKELGFDSLTAVELRNRLAAATGSRLPAGVVFDHPNVVALAEFLRGRLAKDLPGTSPLAELDRLQTSLATVEGDLRAEVRARLLGLVAQWDAQAEGGTENPAAEEAVTGELLVASDDEVFDFIGKEFGIS